MLNNYFILAFRNIWKRKATTAINVLSLAVGLTSCALVFLFYQHEQSFDKGFDNAGRIYRVVTAFRDGGKAPTAGLPFVKYLKAEIPEVEEAAMLDPTNGVTIVQVNGNGPATPYTVNSGYWVDPSFFNVLSFHFLQGVRETAFKAPNTIVISETLAKRLFNAVYPIGKSLKINGNIYTVTGVFTEDLLNHMQPDFLASNNSDGVREKIAGATNWVVGDNYYTYIKLKPNYNLQHVLNEITHTGKRAITWNWTNLKHIGRVARTRSSISKNIQQTV